MLDFVEIGHDVEYGGGGLRFRMLERNTNEIRVRNPLDGKILCEFLGCDIHSGFLIRVLLVDVTIESVDAVVGQELLREFSAG